MLYTASIYLLNNYLNVDAFDKIFWVKIMIICSVAWLPIYVIEVFIKCVTPTEIDRINMSLDMQRRRSSFAAHGNN